MPTVIFELPEALRRQPGNTHLPASVSVEGAPGENLLELAQDHHLPIEAKCGGNCACTTCHVYVLNGALPPVELGSDEEFLLEDLPHFLPEQSRLACQCSIPEQELRVELAGEDWRA